MPFYVITVDPRPVLQKTVVAIIFKIFARPYSFEEKVRVFPSHRLSKKHMVEPSYDSSLMSLLLVLVILIFAGLGWCFLSSCMGAPMLHSISELWNAMILSGSTNNTAGSRRRRAIGEENMWEMTDYRRGP